MRAPVWRNLGLIFAAVLFSLVLGLGVKSCSAQSDVTLSEAEADSLLQTIEYLEIDLWQCQEIAKADSSAWADRLAVVKDGYEERLSLYREERPSWFQRFIREPVIWLGIGLVIGVQAAK